MADLESKIPELITIKFNDGSTIEIKDWWASYIWLHLKNSSDLIPLLYRSTGIYSDTDVSFPISALLEQGTDYEPRTR